MRLTNVNKHIFIFFALLLTILPVSADELAAGFRKPPEATKPWCYWYWLKGDVSKEGITKDLEAMDKVGIKLAMIGNIEGGGPVKMFSPEWYELTHHAFREANRLSVELMLFNGPGWSQSGGPWIKPEQSMRRVAWTEFPAQGGAFSQKVRPEGLLPGHDIAVLAMPRRAAVSVEGVPVSPAADGSSVPLGKASWIWQAGGNAMAVPEGTRHFKREFQADPAKLRSAFMKVTADNSYALTVNGKPVLQDGDWKTVETVSLKEQLVAGLNTVSVAVKNIIESPSTESPAGLIAALSLTDADGKEETIFTDASWQASSNGTDGWAPAQAIGPINMAPWALKDAAPSGGAALRFTPAQPLTARSLIVHGKGSGKLYALRDGERQFIADIEAAGGSATTDFLPDAVETFSFPDVTAGAFELVPGFGCRVELSSAPTVAQVIEKQMGRMHPTPSPTWHSYLFPATSEPSDDSTVVKQKQILNLTDKLNADGVLNCTLPAGNWTILHFGMVTTGKMNTPAPPEATGLEADKMSKAHIRHHFKASIGPLMKSMTPEERAAFKGITIDSYEVGSQNWTDGFAAEFERRNGYNPILLLPVMTGRVVDAAKTSDQFLWDLRRTVADMIAENYVGGLREIAHENGLRLWCENYGHWGFPGEFLIYGGHTDEIGGEFWSTGGLGTIECRAASSSGHIYGKRRIYAEAFTSGLDLGHHPYALKARGEELFCEGINHFVLHVYAHQARDGMPGTNPWFGTAFHRNTPWFLQSRAWVTYLQRCHFMLQQGDPMADVAVYIGDFAPQMTGPANPVPAGYDYDFMGSDAILRKLDVIHGKWVVYDELNPKRIASRYTLLALPEAGHIRPQVLKRIEELKRAGGKVVHAVPVPLQALQELGVAPLVSETTCPTRWKARQLDDGMLFFLSNFGATGTFEAKLRVTGKVPELFNPVTGESRKLARYTIEKDGTRICLPVNDRADSFFVIFRGIQQLATVVKVQAEGKDVGPGELALYYDEKNRLTAESSSMGLYTLALSDGTEKCVRFEKASESLPVSGAWTTTNMDPQGFSMSKEITFSVPSGFGKGQKVELELGKVEVMARVTLNGKAFETLWMPPFALDVTEALKTGDNTLTVLVTSTSQGKPAMGDVKLRTIATERIQ